MRETLKICDKSYIMSEGSVIADGDAGSVVNNQHKLKTSIWVRILIYKKIIY